MKPFLAEAAVPAQEKEERMPHYIEIVPGATERGYMFELDRLSLSIGDAISEALAADATGVQKLVQNSLGREYTRDAGITLENGQKLMAGDLIEKYAEHFETRKTKKTSTAYKLLRIKVARPQEGGLFLTSSENPHL